MINHKLINKKAFTIVELVIVISVIAILSAVLIPSFINLKKRADLSSDEQTVRELNLLLESDEKINGTKESINEVKTMFEGNGYNPSNINAVSSDNSIYWDQDTNRLLLFSKKEGKVIYPSNLVDKYKDLSTISMRWYKISDVVESIDITDFDSLKEEVQNSTNENNEFKLSQDLTIENFNNTFPMSNTGKTVYDLNSKTLTLNSTSSSLQISDGQKLHIKNGKINITRETVTTVSAAFYIKSGSAITLENVEIYSDGSILLPEGAAAEVNIISSKLSTTGAYVVSTNSSSKDNFYVNINIKDSKLYATDSDSTAVLINVPGALIIENSELTAGRQGLFVRCGNCIVKKSKITVTGSFSKDAAYDDFLSKAWQSGNNAPSCALLIGSYQSNNKGAYQGDAVCEISDSKIISKEKTIPGIYIQGNATFVGTQYKAILKYKDNNEITVEGSETSNKLVVRGTVNGASVVNGTTYTTDHNE